MNLNAILGHFLAKFIKWQLSYLCPRINVTWNNWWWDNIGSDNDLVPSGIKPLPEPVLTRIYVVILRH